MNDLDRWTLVLPLGTGAFGQVHLAWDTIERRWVAVKRFTGQDELGLLRFVIESRIRVAHPHLVRTLAFRLVDDRAWLVTQLARGGSLRQLMTRVGPLPWGWVAQVVDQVLDALVALHATGVVHRDLKPANLLLRDAGAGRPHLLVGDFGIATWRTVSMTGIGAAIGTPGYLAPEYLDGQQPSPATDVFAVGVLAAELLSGRRLVHHSNASRDLPGAWSDFLPLPAGVPPHLAAVLRRMADPDPRRRYVDCAQAREALLAAAAPESGGALTAVEAPDLLSGLPLGWTVHGPAGPDIEETTRTTAGVPASDAATSLVAATPPAGSAAALLVAGTPPASGSTTPPAERPSGSVTPVASDPPTPTADNPNSPRGTGTPLAAARPTSGSTTPPAERPDPATGSATPSANEPPTSSTSPAHDPNPASGAATPPAATPPTNGPTTPPAGIPDHTYDSATPPASGPPSSTTSAADNSNTASGSATPPAAVRPASGSTTLPGESPEPGESPDPASGSATPPTSDPPSSTTPPADNPNLTSGATTPPAATPPTHGPPAPPAGIPDHTYDSATPPASGPTTPAAGIPNSANGSAIPPTRANPPASRPTTPPADRRNFTSGPTTPPAGTPNPANGSTAPSTGIAHPASGSTPPAGMPNLASDSTPSAGNPNPTSSSTPSAGNPNPTTGSTSSADGPDPASYPDVPSGSSGDGRRAVVGRASKSRARRRLVRRVLLVVLLLVAGGAAGAVWWAVGHRVVVGHAVPAGGRVEGASEWTPVLVERCTRAELARERSGRDGTERCQRVLGADAHAYWVTEPPSGFPKSDPDGPFPTEPCGHDTDTAYSPVGDRVVCTAGAWRVVT